MNPEITEIKEIRNIAIIAHVDHGKTTLTDALMQQCGAAVKGVTMDSNAIEQERGITIYAKNTSVYYKGTKINIVDTPGHADFGSEVERVLRAVDTVLLVVDAQEGPMPQTRFVLKKSLELGLKPIVVINKIDKPAANPKHVHNEVFELFFELGATDEQLDFKTIYAIGREGVAMLNPEDERKNLFPLLDLILEIVPPKLANTEPFSAQVFNLGYDAFLGRLAIARIYSGSVNTASSVIVKKATGESRNAKLAKVFTFEGLQRKEENTAQTGDIVMLAGIPDIFIGETICNDANVQPLPAIAIDEPTISLYFLVNDSPFAGKDGKFVTSRQIRERLERELEMNVGLRVDFNADTSGSQFLVYGRGELHIAVLLEMMRREGFEVQVSQPKVIEKEINGVFSEPYEEVIVDVPTEFSGSIIETLTRRRGLLHEMREDRGITRIRFEMPTRGLLGYRNQFVIDTKGEGIISSRFVEFRKHAGEIEHRDVGSMTSMMAGKALAFALWGLQERGILYITPGTDVYIGQVIGNVTKGDEMTVNPTKGKNLTNVRASGSDEAIYLKPAYEMTIERGLETISGDEYLEVTPHFVRLRKKYLTELDRIKANR